MATFTLEVSVTEKCNLACPYCYVANIDKFLSIEKFDKAFIEFKKMVHRSSTTGLPGSGNQGEKYHVSYFGGEPLLNMELIRHATKKFKADPACEHVGIISNLSLLTEEIMEYIERAGLGVSWSFDGLSSNESRPLVKNMEENKGFDNVLDMYNSKRDLLKRALRNERFCKVMLFPGNIENMTENLQFLVEMGINCPDFMCVRDDIWSEEDIRVFRVECHRMADQLIKYFDQGKIIVIGMFHLAIRDILIGMTKSKRPWGCFAGTHGAVMSVEGEFYPCARFASKKLLPMSGKEYNGVEDYDFAYWQKQLNPQNYSKCKSCKLYKVCNAGCSYSQIRNGNQPVDSVCELNHIFYDETLRIAEECKNMPAYIEYVKKVFTGGWDNKYLHKNADVNDIKESIKRAAEQGSNHVLHPITPTAMPYKEVAVYG